MSRFLAAVAAVFLFFVFALPATAATTGLVRGTVTANGKPVAGASVTLNGSGSHLVTKTDAEGRYAFPIVPFGHYTLTAQAPGEPPASIALDVASGSVATIDVPLGSLKQIANTVASAAAGPNGYPPSVNVLTRNEIQTSPDNNSLDKLIETLPGVVPFSYNEPVINGFHGVTYNVDGAPLPLATTSNFAEIIDPKNVDSIELLTGAIPAEYGGDRMGGVVNIITNRVSDLPDGFYGTLTGGFGNQSQAIGSLDLEGRAGSTAFFLNTNTQSNARGIDAPTYTAINDNSSQSDEFFRAITELTKYDTLSFDYSNQLAQFQVPINTDPNNINDPIVSVPGTQDTQLEYDRFSSLNFTATSADGNGVFQFIPWWRSTRVDYDGDLPLDVLGYGPNFGCNNGQYPDCGNDPSTLPNTGYSQNSYASYIGLRTSYLRSGKHHTVKGGLDVDRENATASQVFACYYEGCGASGTHTQPYYLLYPTPQGQAGSQIGAYLQDNWQPNQYLAFNYGVRYDHSTGYTSGYQISPRIDLNVWDGGKNVAHVYYGQFYAAPLLEDVRQDCVVLQGCTGTPVYDLQPERDFYYEIGLKHSFNSSFTGSVNVFEKDVSNILDTTQLLNTPLFAVYNNAIGRNTGLEIHLQDRLPTKDEWFLTGTISGSYAGGISGSTFLFPPNPPGISQTDPAGLSVEDHDETVVSTAGYTHKFGGAGEPWFATLQAQYGSGFPVQFEDADVNLNGRLPAHTTFDLSAGRLVYPGKGPDSQGLGVRLDIDNLLNHQYVIKIANGFNTTQIANGRTVLLRLTAPF
jgi:outer membrane receptor protein involved in Fe transport